jgi:hypothetical protein
VRFAVDGGTRTRQSPPAGSHMLVSVDLVLALDCPRRAPRSTLARASHIPFEQTLFSTVGSGRRELADGGLRARRALPLITRSETEPEGELDNPRLECIEQPAERDAADVGVGIGKFSVIQQVEEVRSNFHPKVFPDGSCF